MCKGGADDTGLFFRLLAGPSHRVWAQQAWLLLRRAVREFQDDHCPQFAAAMSYHVLFSLFPLAITAVGIIGLATQASTARDAVITAVLKVVPLSSSGSKELRSLLTSVNGTVGGLGLLGLLGVIWSASGVMASVRTALNVAWDTTEKRPFLRGKAVDLALIAGVYVSTGILLALTIAAGLAREGASNFHGAFRFLGPLAGGATLAATYVVSTTVVLAIFALVYRLVPAVPTSFRNTWPGAVAGAVGFEALQFGFSFYVAHFAHYNKVYGSLGAVIAFLFFVYLASMIFLFGAEVASEYPRLPPPGQTGQPAPADDSGP